VGISYGDHACGDERRDLWNSVLPDIRDGLAYGCGSLMTSSARGGGGVRPGRFGARTRKGFLVAHIASAGAWIGIDVVMGVLVFTALLGDEQTRALCYRALELFAVWPLIATGLVCLASGVVLGLGTKWGLIRYWWVVLKLALNVVLVGLVPLALRPEVIEKAEQGRRFAVGEPASLAVGNLIFPPIVSPTLLLIALVLAVFKPWGPIRRPRAPKRDTR
jgi:hypothetical protein